MMNDSRNINLEVAQFALESVKEILENDKEEKNKPKDKQNIVAVKYKTISKKITVLIQKNGLIGALVFILSKANKEQSHKYILKHTRKWCEENPKLEFLKNKFDFKDNESFIESITGLKSEEYRLVTKEIMNLFGWIKRFTDGMIEGEDCDA